jgi:hypothetical protein
MMGIIMRLKSLFDNIRDRSELEKLHRQRRTLDKRIDNLERMTLDGEDEWFIKVVRKDPSCALKIINECGGEKQNARP